MNLITILLIVGGAVLFLVVLGVSYLTVSNKKKAQKLNKVLSEYKKKSKEEPKQSPIKLSGEEERIDEKKFSSKAQPVVEDYVDPDMAMQKTTEETSSEEPDIQWEDFKFIDDDEEEKKEKAVKQEPKDDFDEFLDKYSYTRKIIDKDMIKKLNSLPPEVKNAILGNFFNKYE